MARVGLIMALISLVLVALVTAIPFLGPVVLAPLTSLVLGAVAGWWVSRAMGYGTAGRGAGAGAIAGLGALIGSVIGLVLFASMLAQNPELQQSFQEGLEQARQEDPNADIPDLNVGALAAIGGSFAGFCFGLFDHFLATIGGLIAGAVSGRNRPPAMATPAASYPAVGQPMTGETVHLRESEGGARIYPDDQQRQ